MPAEVNVLSDASVMVADKSPTTENEVTAYVPMVVAPRITLILQVVAADGSDWQCTVIAVTIHLFRERKCAKSVKEAAGD